jgi:hypothetical protein
MHEKPWSQKSTCVAVLWGRDTVTYFQRWGMDMLDLLPDLEEDIAFVWALRAGDIPLYKLYSRHLRCLIHHPR